MGENRNVRFKEISLNPFFCSEGLEQYDVFLRQCNAVGANGHDFGKYRKTKQIRPLCKIKG